MDGKPLFQCCLLAACFFLAACPSVPVRGPSDEFLPTPGFRQPASSTTTDESIEVRGFAQPNLTIEIYVNGKHVDTAYSDLDGEFRLAGVPLDKGVNVIRAVAIDPLGRRSRDSTVDTGSVEYAGSQYKPEIRITRN